MIYVLQYAMKAGPPTHYWRQSEQQQQNPGCTIWFGKRLSITILLLPRMTLTASAGEAFT